VCGQKILTDAAKAEIRTFLETKPENGQGLEYGRPALMLPSVKPLHYSFVGKRYRPIGLEASDTILTVVYAVFGP
jgi:hypothetical protein